MGAMSEGSGSVGVASFLVCFLDSEDLIFGGDTSESKVAAVGVVVADETAIRDTSCAMGTMYNGKIEMPVHPLMNAASATKNPMIMSLIVSISHNLISFDFATEEGREICSDAITGYEKTKYRSYACRSGISSPGALLLKYAQQSPEEFKKRRGARRQRGRGQSAAIGGRRRRLRRIK